MSHHGSSRLRQTRRRSGHAVALTVAALTVLALVLAATPASAASAAFDDAAAGGETVPDAGANDGATETGGGPADGDATADGVLVVCPPDDTHTHGGPGGDLDSPAACEYTDVQAAVDDAEPGQTVYLQAGTYHQNVSVTDTPRLTIAGAGRNEAVLTGATPEHDHGGENNSSGDEHHAEQDGIYVSADDVTVRDLTVREFSGDGVYYEGVVGFRVARVDAVNNGAYGIYAIRSTLGTFADSYAAGHYDSGFYLGEVRRCDCVIRNVTAEANLLGYSGTGASYITIENSTWRDNAAGIVPNVLPNEPAPQTNLVVEDNRIVNNNNRTAFREWHFAGSLHAPVGSGVIIGGGSFNTVRDNDIRGHERAGVVVTNMFTQPSGNAVIHNEFDGNELDVWWDGGGAENCFDANDGSAENGSLRFDAGAYWNERGSLPRCDETPSAAPPDPSQLSEIASVVVFGCEQSALPDGENCHVEEPDPHVHPPSSPAATGADAVRALFGEEAAAALPDGAAGAAGGGTAGAATDVTRYGATTPPSDERTARPTGASAALAAR